jgi:hypothetical protein
MIPWLTATGDSGNPSWPGMFLAAGGPDELGDGAASQPGASARRSPIHSLRIMARLLCPDAIEAVVMIGANPAFVRNLRRQRLATYFECWRALGAQVAERLDNLRPIGTQSAALAKPIRRARAAYHMIRLAMSGAIYGLGARVNPATSLERIALLFGETIAGQERGSGSANDQPWRAI